MQICREHGVFYHVDAAQSAGKIEIDVEAMKIDLMSLSAHKMYGPKGVGALFMLDESLGLGLKRKCMAAVMSGA